MKRTFAVTALATALVLGACGRIAETSTTTAATSTTDATTTTESVPEGLVTTVEDLASATIQIVSTGSFVTPDFGEFEGGGSG